MSGGAVYLDNAATTPVDPRVAARMMQVLSAPDEFGNAASSHGYGETAAALIETARRQLADSVGAHPDEVVWTSGATEADNLAIFGVAQYYQEFGRHIVTSRTEHTAVLDACRELQRRGWRVSYLAPGASGLIDPAQVAAALQPDTVLVSLMLVNNEIGVLQDIRAVAAICAAREHTWLHVDAAQAVGKTRVNFAALQADLLSLSAHKAYGPKGAGALLVAEGVHLTPLQYGGGQERRLRSGTLATHQIVGMGLALQYAAQNLDAECERVLALRERLWQGLAQLGGVLRNGAAQHCVPHLLNVCFEGVEGESLLAAVSPYVAVSTGSACSSASREPSYVLRALGRSERLSESSLRFGLGRFTGEQDIDQAIAVLQAAVPKLRRVAGSDRAAGSA